MIDKLHRVQGAIRTGRMQPDDAVLAGKGELR